MNTEAIKTRVAEILLIEDNSSDALLTRKAFRALTLPYNITVAKDADEALSILGRKGEYASCNLPDLILLDLHLPKISGRELLVKIKADPLLRHIPVVVLTGSLAETDIVKSYDLEAHSYMVKPVNIMQQTFIEELLDKRVQA